MAVTIRPFRATDRAAVNALHRAVAWPERSDDGWRWLDDNPARQDVDAPSGWVAVDGEDHPQAFVGNFIQRFHLGGDVAHGATGFSIIVPPQARGAAHGLIRAILRQPGMAAHYTLNANPRAARLYPRHGLEAWPTATNGLKLAWTINPWVCGAGKALRAVASWRTGIEDRWGERLTNRRLAGPLALTLPNDVAVLDRLGDASPYADYWRAMLGGGRVLADRSPETMRWRLSNPDLKQAPLVLAAMDGDRIRGHALAMVGKGCTLEPPILEILDLTALPGEEAAIERLARALIANARALGAAKVRLQVVDDRMRAALGVLVDQARTEGGWGHGHARFSPEQNAAFRAGWAPTPFDGDYSFCTRPAFPGASARRPHRVATDKSAVTA